MLTAFILANVTKFIASCNVHWKHLVLFGAIIVTFVTASAWVQGGGWLLYGEADWFLIDHNTDQRSLLNKILAPHKHDADQYLAREITHIVEHIDAVFIHKCVMAGQPHFLSLSTYCFFTAIAFAVWLMLLRNGVNVWHATLLIAAFLSSPPIFMGGNYVRPGHAHAAFWATMLILYLYQQLHLKSDEERPKALAVTLLLSLAAVWADRQGLFAACVIAFTLFTFRRFIPAMHGIMIGLAVVIHSAYSITLGPYLISRLTDFTVGKEYQGDIINKMPNIVAENAWGAFNVMMTNVGVMFGSIAPLGGVAIVVAISYRYRKQWWMPVLWFSSGVLMYALIMYHQKALVWPDMISSNYYNIFGMAMILLISAYALKTMHGNFAAIFLGICLASNIGSMPSHIRAWTNGHLGGFMNGRPFLLSALRQTANMPNGTSTNRFDAIWMSKQTGFDAVMKNPIEKPISANEFVESSQYLQFLRSEKHMPFGKGGR